VPLHIEYSLTKKGDSLQEILQKMGEWGEKEVEE
jgi:DNA-binding HxlR family transcriptional regulator